MGAINKGISSTNRKTPFLKDGQCWNNLIYIHMKIYKVKNTPPPFPSSKSVFQLIYMWVGNVLEIDRLGHWRKSDYVNKRVSDGKECEIEWSEKNAA